MCFRIAIIMMFDFQIQNLCLLTYKNETWLGPVDGLFLSLPVLSEDSG